MRIVAPLCSGKLESMCPIHHENLWYGQESILAQFYITLFTEVYQGFFGCCWTKAFVKV